VRERRHLGALAAGALVGLLGCGTTKPSSSATKACDPLADAPQPVMFGTILGAGRDAAGTVYVIDRPMSGTDRLFVSDGMTLKRQPVSGSGSGSSPQGGTFEIVNSGTGADALAVEITKDPAGDVAMGVVHGPLKTKTFTIGTDGEALTVLDAGALSGYTLANLPGTIDVEYDATLPDGRTMVVTRPDVDWTYADFRLFLSASAGAPLLERKVASVDRGSSTSIFFDLDGQQAQAHFSDGLLAPGPSTLTVGADSYDLTVMAPGASPTGLTFLCL
jgi:hypothetical protein